MVKEEREGPPTELFKKPREFEHEDEVNEQNIYETGDAENEVDEDALRKYQLERLRYPLLPTMCTKSLLIGGVIDTIMRS